MKKLGVAILSAVFLCGCDEQPMGEDGSYEFNEDGRIIIDSTMQIKKVDGSFQ